MRSLFIALMLCLYASATQSQEVWQCTEKKNAGIVWDGAGTRVTAFGESNFAMIIDSEEKRRITVGQSVYHVVCGPTDPREDGSDTTRCVSVWGGSMWLFRGKQFTSAYLLGKNLGGTPFITVSHGTCTKS